MAPVVVYADVACPFTHVGLCRLAAERARRGRRDVLLEVRAWPLELVNGAPLSADLVAAEVDVLRRDVAPELFRGFAPASFPATSLPALALTAAAYRESMRQGEAVAFALREALFEHGRDVAAPDVLADVAERFGVPRASDLGQVRSEYEEGRERGVVGSPHFFVGGSSRFCPTLDVTHVDGELVVHVDREALGDLADACFA